MATDPLAGSSTTSVNAPDAPAAPSTPSLIIPDLESQPISPAVPSAPSSITMPKPAAPERRPAPGSFGEKIARAAEVLGIPPGPGGWARSLVGAAQAALTNLGDVQEGMKNVRPGGGPLSGALSTLAAGNAREQAAKQAAQEAQQKEQERQDKLKQQDVENRRLDDEAHARIAMANAQTHQVMTVINKQDLEAKQAKMNQDQSDFTSWEAAGIPLEKANTRGPVNEREMTQMIAQGKANGYEYMPFVAKIADEGVDENNNPMHRLYYDIVKVPAQVPLTKDMIDRIHMIPGWEKYEPAPGSQLSGHEAYSLLTQANVLKTSNDALLKSRQQAKIDDFTREQQDSAMAFLKDGTFMNYLRANAGSPVQAAQHMLQDPNLQKTYGGNLYHDVVHSLFSSKSDPEGEDNFQKAVDREKEIQAKLLEAKLKKLDEGGFEGNYNLTGDAFLNSMPDPGERRLVAGLARGQMPLQLMARLSTKNPKVFQAVPAYDPGFDGNKVTQFLKTAERFGSGKEGGAIRSAGAAIESLKKLYDFTDESLPGMASATLAPDSPINKKRADLASVAATDYARFELGGSAPDKETLEKRRQTLDPRRAGIVDPINRRADIEALASAAKSTLDQYQSQWNQDTPSKIYNHKAPKISPQAEVQLNYIVNKGKYVLPEGVSGTVGKTKDGQWLISLDGKKTWNDAEKVLTQLTQQRRDQDLANDLKLIEGK